MSGNDEQRHTKTEAEIINTVLKLISRNFDISLDRIRLDSTLSEFGGDSLDMMELAIEIEDALVIFVPDCHRSSFETVDDIIRACVLASPA